jgi:hypothetical protein
VVQALDGKRTITGVNYRPDRPLPLDTAVNVYDDGPVRQPANDNERLRYPLKEMADSGGLGINEYENRLNWTNAERLKIHFASALGESPT